MFVCLFVLYLFDVKSKWVLFVCLFVLYLFDGVAVVDDDVTTVFDGRERSGRRLTAAIDSRLLLRL